jgi:D-alanyl-D-alanine carboxypeptidase (penicillin-binding protein 5/6)
MPHPAPRPRPESAADDLPSFRDRLSLLDRRAFLRFAAVGLLCWAAAPAAEAKHFLFRDYGARPRLTPPDEIKAIGALLIDAQTGEVLYARNTDKHLLPASTTKLMTALIAFEYFRGFNGSVVASEEDRAEPSNIPLIPGERVSLWNMFNALLIESANDAARCLGRTVAGSTPAFVNLMNQRAQAMGLANTHFYNPNGLPAPAGTHYTCCADLMKIFQAVLRHPELRSICSTREFSFRTASGFHNLRNHNRLLGYYPGMGAAKTGWTVASRHTYAASVRRGGRELLLTLLDSPDKWIDAQILFNWGFEQRPANTTDLPTANDGDVEAQTSSLSAAPGAPIIRTLPPAPAGRANETPQ